MRHHTLFALTSLALSAPNAWAQRLADLPAGRMVRIEMTNNDIFSGPLLDVTADSVRIRTPKNQPPVALATRAIRAYSIGAGPDVRRGVIDGLKIGGGFGLLLLVLDRSLGPNNLSKGARFGARSLAVVSTGLGVAIGMKHPPERWIAPTPAP